MGGICGNRVPAAVGPREMIEGGRGVRRKLVGVSLLGLTTFATLLTLGPSPAAQTKYQAPRTSHGHPNLQGVWQVLNTANWDLEDHSGQLGIPPGLSVVDGGDIPYKPEALAQRNKYRQQRLTADPVARCQLPGVPRATYLPFPFQIIQNADGVLIVYEYVTANRQIYTSAAHANRPPNIDGLFMGDSRGHWDGDTLVVDVARFGDQTWLDGSGNFHSDQLHVVERYTRTGPDHIRYEATIEDPQVFTRPWKISMTLYRRQEQPARLLEYICTHDIDVAKGQKVAAEGRK
jgi:hypothetical protein